MTPMPVAADDLGGHYMMLSKSGCRERNPLRSLKNAAISNGAQGGEPPKRVRWTKQRGGEGKKQGASRRAPSA